MEEAMDGEGWQVARYELVRIWGERSSWQKVMVVESISGKSRQKIRDLSLHGAWIVAKVVQSIGEFNYSGNT